MTELPAPLLAQLRPSCPRLRILLRVLHEDPRETLSIDDVLVGLYLHSNSEIQKRSTVTQQLYNAVQIGLLERVARGRYSITGRGREWLRVNGGSLPAEE